MFGKRSTTERRAFVEQHLKVLENSHEKVFCLPLTFTGLGPLATKLLHSGGGLLFAPDANGLGDALTGPGIERVLLRLVPI